MCASTAGSPYSTPHGMTSPTRPTGRCLPRALRSAVMWRSRRWGRYHAVMDGADERLVQVPGLVRQRVLHLGQRGERWLAQLPTVIAHLERAWSITVGPALEGGTGSYVA